MEVTSGEEDSQPFTQNVNLPESLFESTTDNKSNEINVGASVSEDISPQGDSVMVEVTEDTAAPAVEKDTNEQISQPTTASDSHSDEMNVDTKDKEPCTRDASVVAEGSKDSDMVPPDYPVEVPEAATSSVEPTTENQVVEPVTHMEIQTDGLEDDSNNENIDPQGEHVGKTCDQDDAIPSIEHEEASMGHGEPIPQVVSNPQPMKSLFAGLQPKPHLFAKPKLSDTMDHSMPDATSPVFDSISQQLSSTYDFMYEDVPASIPENDSAWMDDFEDEEDFGDFQLLSAQIEFLHALQNTRKLSQSESINLKRLESRFQQAESRRAVAHRGRDEQQENGDDDDDDLFVPWRQASPMEEGELSEDDWRNLQESAYSLSQPVKEEEAPQKRQLRKRKEREDSTQEHASAKKQRRKAARNYAETMARKEEDRVEKERRKVEKGKGKAVQRNVASGKKPASKKSNKSFGKNNGGIDRRGFLSQPANTNAIAAQAAQPDFGEAPVINATTLEAQTKQFEQFIANIPEDLDIHKAKHDQKSLRKAAKNFGLKNVKARDGNWLLTGMKSPLKSHQLLAADWMLGREFSSTQPTGGVNADAMGLGKTIELLAVLVVVPTSIVEQWAAKIAKHVEDHIFPRVIIYKSSANMPKYVLEDADIVVTTYGEVSKSWPYLSPERIRKIGPEEVLKWQDKASVEKGLLHEINWYRIVLDEAHAIKNYESKTSIACKELLGKYRWALSGTPITNRIEEVYPYIRFLKATEFCEDHRAFQNQFCGKDAQSQSRLAVLLGTILIRRTMTDKLMGRPMVELPESHDERIRVKFTPQEQVLYRLVEDKFRANVNRHLAEGTVSKHFGVYFVQLLRLRQLTNHPFLLQGIIQDIFAPEDIAGLKSQLRKLSRENTEPLHEQIQQSLFEQIQQWIHSAPFGRSSFGTHFDMAPYLDDMPDDSLDQTTCVFCGETQRTDALMTDCIHLCCKGCVEQFSDEFSGDVQCPKCFKVIKQTKPWKIVDKSPSKEPKSRPKPTKKGNGKQVPTNGIGGSGAFFQGTDYMGFEPKMKSTWLELADNNRNVDLLPSATLIALKAIILNIFRQHPDDKIIVFSQFKLSQRIIARICGQEGKGFVYFTGDMKTDQRARATSAFMNDDEVKVMVAGLKCEGVGLNLTRANHVISLDLWWNDSIENQAFGRVFRMGQQKETHFIRLFIPNSIDQRWLTMQFDKAQTVNGAMQGDRAARKLTLEQIMGLFGHVDKDENGNLRVEDDYTSSSEIAVEREDAISNASRFGSEDNGGTMGESSRQPIGLGISVNGRQISLEDYSFDNDDDDDPVA